MIVKCRVCDHTLKSETSIKRGVGPVCAKHEPPQHVLNHPNSEVRGWAKNAYESAKAAYLLKRNKMPYDSMYLTHLAVEKSLKAKMIHETGKFEYGHNLTTLIKNANIEQSMLE